MPDITMCEGQDCPFRETCYRYRAVPNEWRQSYFSKPPFKEGQCSYYWEITKETKMKVRKDES